jgi:hypothetical protein
MTSPSDFDELGAENARKLAVKKAFEVEKKDTIWLMSDARGRRVAYAELERAGVWRTTFSTDALQMAFNEGMRNTGLILLSKLTTHCSHLYNKMIDEAKNDRSN